MKILKGNGPSAPLAITVDVGGTVYVIPGWHSFAQNTGALAQHELYYVPIYHARPKTYATVYIEVTTGQAAAVIRLGAYKAIFNTAGEIVPDALLDDWGTVDASSAAIKSIGSLTTVFPAGYSFLAFSTGTASVAVRTYQNSGQSYGMPVTGQGAAISTLRNTTPTVTVADGAAALADPATAPDAVATSAFCGMVQLGL